MGALIGKMLVVAGAATFLVVTNKPTSTDKPLTPADAIKRAGEKVTVQMVVKATKNALEKRGEIYLDSEESFRDEKNLAIVIGKAAAAKFKDAGIADPAVHFKGKTIRVTGIVSVQDQRARIEVADPKQIEEGKR